MSTKLVTAALEVVDRVVIFLMIPAVATRTRRAVRSRLTRPKRLL
jgi:hypothetical protein